MQPDCKVSVVLLENKVSNPLNEYKHQFNYKMYKLLIILFY